MRRHFPVMAGAEPEPWQNLQRLRAAEGWLELGLIEEAHAELAAIGPDLRCGMAGLDLQWQLFAERGHWDAAFAVAQQAVDLHPTKEGGWLNRAYAARRRVGGGVAAAHELLLPAQGFFPESTIIPFNLACYSAQLGRLDTAWSWLILAAARGGWKTIGPTALKDADLEALRSQIQAAMKLAA